MSAQISPSWQRPLPQDRASGGARDAEDAWRAAFDASPYLETLAKAEPDIASAADEDAFDRLAADALARLDAPPPKERAKLSRELRAIKGRIALITALADLGGHWPLAKVTATLSRAADGAANRALRFFLNEARLRGELDLEESPEIEKTCGYTLLGMGKLGADELNYSSDIDLIALFEPQKLRTKGRVTPMALAARLTRSLCAMLEQKTKDGYVFRTDLRLRPHPAGQPLALSFIEAELYYERHGQNWERAAMIKARPIAGDLDEGQAFLARLRPFLWRKHLDYAAIADIHSIKRQINAHRGYARIKTRGHDVKVGRGGIREIEFFTQTQQLILGGRHEELRAPRTVEALEALRRGRWIADAAAAELSEAYAFLRHVEHRLQMREDQQTQRLPERDAEVASLARFCGFDDAASFEAALAQRFARVEKHFAALFEREPDLGGAGVLVFTGGGDHPETLQTLERLGFSDPAAISERIRHWHKGHVRATRSARARELLTELTPTLLEAVAKQPDADAAFALFDRFLGQLPAGVQLFSLFRANPNLLQLVADVMGAAPRLASRLAIQVDLLEALLEPDFFEPLPSKAALREEIDGRMASAHSLEEALGRVRLWCHTRQFQAGLHVLMGASSAERAAIALTGVAEAALSAMLAQARAWLAANHGEIEGGAFCVLGLGKLGANELTVGSDLDLVFVFDAPEGARSNGARPLDAPAYFARLGQRLVSALTTKTPEGGLFDIDTRLRPSGSAGPFACSIANFRAYHAKTAETWELQALTRARPVAGDGALAAEASAAIAHALGREGPAGKRARDVKAMRERIFKEHGKDGPWALKHARGGIVELEFLVQLAILRNHRRAERLVARPTAEALEELGAIGALAQADAAELIEAARLFQRLQAVLRLGEEQAFDPAAAPPRQRDALSRAAAGGGERPSESIEALERRLRAAQTLVTRVFEEACAQPASAVNSKQGGANAAEEETKTP